MAILKKAKVYIECVGLQCPYCGDNIGNPFTESHLIDAAAYDELLFKGTATCPTCNGTVIVPANPFISKHKKA